MLLFKLIIPHRVHLIEFLRGAPGIAAGKSGDAPGQEEPELLSTALPIEIFGDTGAPAPRPLSRSASQAGNGAKEPENQGFLRSTNCGGHQGIDAERDIAFV